jgi:hypothetical protein
VTLQRACTVSNSVLFATAAQAAVAWFMCACMFDARCPALAPRASDLISKKCVNVFIPPDFAPRCFHLFFLFYFGLIFCILMFVRCACVPLAPRYLFRNPLSSSSTSPFCLMRNTVSHTRHECNTAAQAARACNALSEQLGLKRCWRQT